MKSNNLPAGTSNNILIIRLSSIGDILLSTPFIRQVRQKFPEVKIDFVVKDIYKDLIKYNPHLDNVFSLRLNKDKSELYELKQTLQERSYQIVFDLHNNLRSNYLKRHLKAALKRSIHKSKIKQSLLVWFKINNYDKEIPIPERYLAVGRDTGVEDDGNGLEIFWNDDTGQSAREKARIEKLELDHPFVALAPGAGFFTKRWPVKKFETLIEIIQQEKKLPIVVFGGKEDNEIGKILSQPDNVINLCGKLSLLETACLLSKGTALVSNDSGLMHMATAVKTPVVAIFGSTVKELGFFPFRSRSQVVENSILSCRPCSHIGRNKCPKGHFKCMEDISVQQVYEEIHQFLRN